MSDASRMTTPIPEAELERRWSAVRAGMAARGLQALVMQASNDWLGGGVRWFTGLPATNGYPRTVVFYAEGGMTIVEMGVFGGRRALGCADALHRGAEEILTAPSFPSVEYCNGYDGALAADALRRRGCTRIGLIAPGALPCGLRDALERTLAPTCVMADATDWVDALKAVKSADEQALLRRAAALQDAVFAAVLGAIRPGMRDVDVAALAEHETLRLGGEQGIVLCGSSPVGQASVFLPRFLQGRTLQRGDHMTLLIEVNGPGGFYTELARTIVLGRASAALREGFAAVLAAQHHSLALLRPGASCAGVALAHDRFMRERGLPAELRLYAHGQGYDMVERPLIRRDETMAIAEGMCLAVHPGYQDDEIFAVVCDNYIIGPDGPGECLHRTEKRIFEV